MNVQTKARPQTLRALPERLHHYAFIIKDQEASRHFFEDILGIPLVATWCERARNAVLGRELDYCHTFYGLSDGGALAFFQYADDDAYEQLKALRPAVGPWEGADTAFAVVSVRVAGSDVTAYAEFLETPRRYRQQKDTP